MYDSQAEIEAFFTCLHIFRPLKTLGAGAFGIAILVEDTVENRQKVFKLPKDHPTTDALRLEGTNLSRLSDLMHPNIIRLFQYGFVPMTWNGVTEQRFYLNMAFGGSSLRSKLGPLSMTLDADGHMVHCGSGKRLPVAEVVRIAIDVCQGLEAAHGFTGSEVRMLHRDVSPDNILIDDQTHIARLADFGIARVIERTTALVSFAGKRIYVDPECLIGRTTVQSDLYSLAITIFEMATGQLPFDTLEQRMTQPPRSPQSIVPELPDELCRIILKGLARAVPDRYAGATEMLADLRPLNARINPLPSYLNRLGECDDGRTLCEDVRTRERVVCRLFGADDVASVKQIARQVARLAVPNVEVYLGDFANEAVGGVFSPAPDHPHLAKRFGGGSLKHPVQLQQLCTVAAKVCDLLAACHAGGIVHGCLSPFSVTLADDETPRLHEVGLGRLFCGEGDRTERLRAMRSQLPFLSPQVLRGRPAEAADDVYSVGAMLHFLIAGQAPLDGDDRERALRGEAVEDRPSNLRVKNPEVTPRLAALIARAVRVVAEQRFPSATELATALRACKWPDDMTDGVVEDALALYPPGSKNNRALLEACNLLAKAEQAQPDSARIPFARATIYFRHGSYNFAIEELEKAERLRPDQAIYDLLGTCYQLQARTDAKKADEYHRKALHSYREALKFGPNALVLEHFAQVLRDHGKHDNAVKRLRESIKLETDPAVKAARELMLEEWGKQPVTPQPPPAPEPVVPPPQPVVVQPPPAPEQPPAPPEPAVPPEPPKVEAPVVAEQPKTPVPAVVQPPAVPEPEPVAEAPAEPPPLDHDDPTPATVGWVPVQLPGSPLDRWSVAKVLLEVGLGESIHIPGYKVQNELGRGGMGVVYLARHLETDRLVALKVMLPHAMLEAHAQEMFRREIENTKVLDHPNVVRLFDAGYENGRWYFTMEYCTGRSLASLLLERGTLPLNEAAAVTMHVLHGLEYAHQVPVPHARKGGKTGTAPRGLVHRDLKPQNIFLHRDGDRVLAKVGDFGLAKVYEIAGESGITLTGVMAGTPGFMPRQQALEYKYAEPEVDVWAAAATLYFMLTGKCPRDFPKGANPWQVVKEVYPVPICRRRADVPASVAEVIDLALNDRERITFPTAHSFRVALEGAVAAAMRVRPATS